MRQWWVSTDRAADPELGGAIDCLDWLQCWRGKHHFSASALGRRVGGDGRADELSATLAAVAGMYGSRSRSGARRCHRLPSAVGDNAGEASTTSASTLARELVVIDGLPADSNGSGGYLRIAQPIRSSRRCHRLLGGGGNMLVRQAPLLGVGSGAWVGGDRWALGDSSGRCGVV
jgi:hypothetical protein